MIAVLVPPGSAAAGRLVSLDPDEAHHLRVRRVADGSAVALRDGSGLVGSGTLRLDGKRGAVEVSEADRVVRPAALVLAVGAGDKERFGWTVEKAAELGASEVVALLTSHAATVSSRVRAEHVERLARRALEATKQCGAPWAPTVRGPLSLEDFLSEQQPAVRWVADPSGESPPARLGAEPIVAVVGPEGGLSPDEREALRAAGFSPIRLGAHILRFETAAVSVAAQVAVARARGPHG